MISREEVIWCYRMMLGREPESERVIAEHMQHRDLAALRQATFASQEFRGQLRKFSKDGPGLPVARVPVDVPSNEVRPDCTPAGLKRIWRRMQSTWEGLGKDKPHFSVLSADEFLPERIDDHLDQFWQTGVLELNRIRRLLLRHGFESAESKVCTEFGCGVGRLSVHLDTLFSRVQAFDISRTHLALAQARASHMGTRNVEFHLLGSELPVVLPPADFVYCRLVLQHNPPPVMAMLLRALLNSLKDGGLAIVQLPTYIAGYAFTVQDYLNSSEGHIEMHCLPQRHLFRIVEVCGCAMLELREDVDAGRPDIIVSNTVTIGRRGAAAL
jgi:SAM-dependent methyltransferase